MIITTILIIISTTVSIIGIIYGFTHRENYGSNISVYLNNSLFETSIYPNPADNELNINLTNVNKSVLIQIISSDGKLVFENFYHNTDFIKVDLEKFNSGIYFCKVESGKERAILKFSKNE